METRGALRVLRVAARGRPAFDTAVSRAILLAVDAGESPETLRLYQPDDAIAFSVTDQRRPGFNTALRIAHEAGFGAVLRLAGGRAALFQRENLAFAWSQSSVDARAEIPARFGATAEWIRVALASLGVDARIGEVPGEYCPGAFSVNAGGARKLAGIGQRIVRRAAHVGGVIAVGGRERGVALLSAVYDALGYELDPATVGVLSEEMPGLDCDGVAKALVDAIANGTPESLGKGRTIEVRSGWRAAEAQHAMRLEAAHRLD